jgi:hypothetical protein
MNDAANTEPARTYSNGYTIYKPNQRGVGGAVRFNLNAEKGAVFVEAASQSGEKQFDWDAKIIMKWGLSDIGAALATLQGRTSQAKLFHKTERASSAFDLTFRDDPERAPYSLMISRQEEADKSLRKVSIPLTHAEAAVLESALRTATTRILGW